jgi:hypothetical protein
MAGRQEANAPQGSYMPQSMIAGGITRATHAPVLPGSCSKQEQHMQQHRPVAPSVKGQFADQRPRPPSQTAAQVARGCSHHLLLYEHLTCPCWKASSVSLWILSSCFDSCASGCVRS